jgi:hypothetical protein
VHHDGVAHRRDRLWWRQRQVPGVGRHAESLADQPAPPPHLVLVAAPGRPLHADLRAPEGHQPARFEPLQDRLAERPLAVQVDGDVHRPRQLQRRQPARRHQLVDAADQPDQPGQRRVGRQRQVVLGQSAANPPQRRHAGQQVTEAKRAQHQRDRPVVTHGDVSRRARTVETSPVVERPCR